MALQRKVYTLIRHSILKSSISFETVPLVHMLNISRFMSSSRLFIGGLSFTTDDQTLKEAFSSFGNVIEARIVVDRESGRSRGFGFVHFENNEDADTAMSSMDGQQLNGRTIRMSYANDDRRPVRYGGYGGSARGSNDS